MLQTEQVEGSKAISELRTVLSSKDKPAEMDEEIFNTNNARNIISEEKAVNESPDYKKLAHEFKQENHTNAEKLADISSKKA